MAAKASSPLTLGSPPGRSLAPGGGSRRRLALDPSTHTPRVLGGAQSDTQDTEGDRDRVLEGADLGPNTVRGRGRGRTRMSLWGIGAATSTD